MTNHWVKIGICGLHYHPSNPFLFLGFHWNWGNPGSKVPKLTEFWYNITMLVWFFYHSSSIILTGQYSQILPVNTPKSGQLHQHKISHTTYKLCVYFRIKENFGKFSGSLRICQSFACQLLVAFKITIEARLRFANLYFICRMSNLLCNSNKKFKLLLQQFEFFIIYS